MKKLIPLMMAVAFLASTVTVTFAQDTKTGSTKSKSKKKSSKKTGDTTKATR